MSNENPDYSNMSSLYNATTSNNLTQFGPTGDIFVQFKKHVKLTTCMAVFTNFELIVKEKRTGNAWIVTGKGDSIELAKSLREINFIITAEPDVKVPLKNYK